MDNRVLGFAILALCACGDAASEGADAGSGMAEDASPVVAPDAEINLAAWMQVPVLFVHGVNGGSDDFDVMLPRLVADGWPESMLFAIDFDDPSVSGCNVDNADKISSKVQSIRASTGSDRVSIVAHSMGTLSSRYFVKNLGGVDVVNTYVTLGGIHHGLSSPCAAPDSPFTPCALAEMCESKDFVGQLNASPSTPGALKWVSIFGTSDDTAPNSSSMLDGAENISVDGVTHAGSDGLQQDMVTYEHVKRVLQYASW